MPNKKSSEHFKGKLGSGQRFAACVKSVSSKNIKDPKAVCAAIGRKKYGKKRFTKMAVKGKK